LSESAFSRWLRGRLKKALPAAVRRKLRSVLAWATRFRLYLYRKIVADKHFRRIGRDSRDRCWCGGELTPFEWHPGYGVCAGCGCYLNRNPPRKDELERLYSFDLFWHIKQKAGGLPVLEKRSAHYKAEGRVDYWLQLIGRYGPAKGKVIEIGCAPGILLKELSDRGYDCLGVEVDRKVAGWIGETMNLDVRAGLFPEVDLPCCDLFLAFDVLEHCPDPAAFMRETCRLLRPGGVAVIQTSIDRYDYVPPFGSRFKEAFDDLEHLFIFTDKAVRELAARSNLEVTSLSEGAWLMGEVVILGKA